MQTLNLSRIMNAAGAQTALVRLRSQVASADSVGSAMRAVDTGLQTSARLIAGVDRTPFKDEGMRALGLTRIALRTAAERGGDEVMRLELLDANLVRAARGLKSDAPGAALQQLRLGHAFLRQPFPKVAAQELAQVRVLGNAPG